MAMLGIALVFAAFIYPLETRRTKDQVDRVRVLLETIYKQKQNEFANALFAGRDLAQLVSLREIEGIVEEIENACLHNADGSLQYCAAISRPVPHEIMTYSKEHDDTTFWEFTEDEQDYCVYINSINIIGERAAYLAIYYNLSTIKKDNAQLMLLAVGLFFTGLLLIILLLNIFLEKAIITPLNVLRRGMRRVTEGNLGETVFLPAKDEIGDMGATFNEMSQTLLHNRDEIRQYHSHLEDLVAERTSELFASKEKAEVAEAEQRKQWEILRIVMETIPNPMFYKDTEGRYVGCNRAFEEFIGATREEILGKTLFDFARPDVAEKLALKDREMLAEAGSESYDWCVFDKNRNKREITFSKAAITDSNNTVTGLVGIMSDITDLVRAREQAELASRAKSQFLANMSHEIRTPMNGVLGMTTLLSDTALDRRQRELVETIETSADSLLLVINDILDYSKIEAGKLVLQEREFRICELLDDCMDILKIKALEKQLDLLCVPHPDLPERVTGDRGRLKQILINLVGNAIKFTENGEVVVGVQPLDMANGQVVLKFSVRDTGIGIAADHQNLLFESFSQVDGSYTRKFGGTGLGLAISKQLVNLLGGEIEVMSEENHGAEFSFTVKMSYVESGSANEKSQLLRDKNILVAIENKTLRKMLAEQLCSRGAHVQERSYSELLGDFTANGKLDIPDAIYVQAALLTDGALASYIKGELAAGENAPCIFITGASDLIRDALGGAWVSGCLPAPVRICDLKKSIAIIRGEKEEDVAVNISPLAVDFRSELDTSLRVLIVEDNHINMQVARGILNRLGIGDIHTAENGEEALTLLESKPFDLVLMDLSMPVLDGFATAERIRSGKTTMLNSNVQIVALTAHAMQTDRERCLAAGMNGYLSKPIEYEELLQVLIDVSQSLEQGGQKNMQKSVVASAVSAETDALILDMPDLVDRLMDDRETAVMILNEVKKMLPEQLDELHDSIEADDCYQAGRQAHKMKGAAANISAPALFSIFRDMEVAGKEDNIEQLHELYPNAVAGLHDLIDEIERLEE